MRFFANANFDFLGLRKKAYVTSATALLIGIGAMIVGQVRDGSWLNYGVDFTGGTLIQVRITEETSVAELRPLIDARLPGSEITAFGEGSEFLIRAPRSEGETAAAASETMIDILRERYGEQFEIVRTEAVSAKVGGELQSRALLAILLSFAATLIYLAFRFEWRFGLAAVIATAHDILLTLGLLALLRLDVALPTVAAVLTIVGYSLNDTIIVFDRVRENLGGTLKRENFVTILNRSINETLPRTVLTSGTTLVTLFALFIFGGGTLRSFAMILIFGIGVGTFSSIFVASPALYEIEKRWPGERVKARVRPRTA
jgi:preprotein translocase subunit SecF